MLPLLNNIVAIIAARTCIALLLLTLAACASGPRSTSSDGSGANVQISQTDRGAMVTTSEKLLFDTGRFVLKPEGVSFVSSLIEMANRNNSRILIEGHTDNVGGAAFNQVLSENRADAVKAAMIAGGIAPGKITIVGLGQSKPVASNESESGRAKNRRTEIILLGELVETIDQDDLFSNMGRSFSSLVGSISERLQTTPSTDTFDPNRRVQELGAVTHCGTRTNSQYIIIDGSLVEPRKVQVGQQAILTINVQLCIAPDEIKTLDQSIRIFKGETPVAAGGEHKFSNMQRKRYSLFSRITVTEAMAVGTYSVESTVNLNGRSYRQTTPLIVQ